MIRKKLKMKKVLRLICGSLILFTAGLRNDTLQAQSTIHGLVKDNVDKPIHNANVLLLRISDSGLIKGMLTDEKGEYVFNHINPGNYFITSTYTGYIKHSTPSFAIGGDKDILNLSAITLSEKGVRLSEVKVAAKKPLLEQKIDRLVINVENSITAAGNTTLEVLERSPGIIVDHQNNGRRIN